MNPEEYKAFSQALKDAPQPKREKAQAVMEKLPRQEPAALHARVMVPAIRDTSRVWVIRVR